MAILPVGYVPELAADDKVPGVYLKQAVETGTGRGTFYLLVVGAKAVTGGAITTDTQVVDILTDADALYWAGGFSEGYRMLLRALSVQGIRIKYAAVGFSGMPVAATASITLGGTWTTTGSVFYRLGGRPVGPISVSTADTPTTIGDAIAAYINARPAFCAKAVNVAGVVTLTDGSYGTRGNDHTIWQDTTNAPSGLTSVLAGGATLASGGKKFSTGAGTESASTLLTNTFSQEYFTNALCFRDATNLALWEAQVDNKLSPLEGRLECVVGALVDTLAASGSVAQTTLNNRSFEMLWMEEAETPGEELAALHAAQRHQLELFHPNRRYDGLELPNVQAQEAVSKRPSRATLVAALNYGLSPLETRNDAVFLTRAVTTRTLLPGGAADDGIIDVAQDRVAKEFQRALKARLTQHMADHQYIVDDPDEGDEPDVPAGTTYPRNIANATAELEFELQNANWITQVANNPPQCALNPLTPGARPVLYAPIVPTPLLHQIEGTVAIRRFTVAVTV